MAERRGGESASKAAEERNAKEHAKRSRRATSDAKS